MNDDERAMVRRLFQGDEPEHDDEQPPGNVVTKEGKTVPPPTDPDAEMRAFTRDLFGRSD